MRSSGVWVYVIGIFMFVWGFCQLAYAFMEIRLPINIPFTEWGAVFGADELFNDMQLGLAFGCMLSGFGMLIFRAWSRVLAIWLVWTFAGFFFYIFLGVFCPAICPVFRDRSHPALVFQSGRDPGGPELGSGQETEAVDSIFLPAPFCFRRLSFYKFTQPTAPHFYRGPVSGSSAGELFVQKQTVL